MATPKQAVIGEFLQSDGWHIARAFDNAKQAREWANRVDEAGGHEHARRWRTVKRSSRDYEVALERELENDYEVALERELENPRRKRNAGRSSSRTATRTATSTKATTTGNKTGTSTGGAVSGGGGNITVSVKRNPPAGFIPCKAVKITRNRGRVEVRIKK